MGCRLYWLEETITYHHRCSLQSAWWVMLLSTTAVTNSQPLACIGFTHSAPMAGFIVLAAHLFMYSYYAHLLQYSPPFRSRSTPSRAKVITFFYAINAYQWPLSDLLIYHQCDHRTPVFPREMGRWEVVGACYIFIRCRRRCRWEELIEIHGCSVGLFIVKSSPRAPATLLTAKHKWSHRVQISDTFWSIPWPKALDLKKKRKCAEWMVINQSAEFKRSF